MTGTSTVFIKPSGNGLKVFLSISKYLFTSSTIPGKLIPTTFFVSSTPINIVPPSLLRNPHIALQRANYNLEEKGQQ